MPRHSAFVGFLSSPPIQYNFTGPHARRKPLSQASRRVTRWLALALAPAPAPAPALCLRLLLRLRQRLHQPPRLRGNRRLHRRPPTCSSIRSLLLRHGPRAKMPARMPEEIAATMFRRWRRRSRTPRIGAMSHKLLLRTWEEFATAIAGRRHRRARPAHRGGVWPPSPEKKRLRATPAGPPDSRDQGVSFKGRVLQTTVTCDAAVAARLGFARLGIRGRRLGSREKLNARSTC